MFALEICCKLKFRLQELNNDKAHLFRIAAFVGRRFYRILHFNHWRRLSFPYSKDREQDGQTADLGYSWTGTIPYDHICVLSGS